MEKISLVAQPRDAKTKPKAFRKEGFIPAVIYGHSIKSQSLKVKHYDFITALRKAGTSKFIDLSVDKQDPVKVLIYDIQKDPLTGDFLHADFYQIRMDEEITTEVPLKFSGESKAVKEEEGILVKNFTELKVTCLPKDLPSDIEVDISPLKTFEDDIHIKDLRISKAIKLENDPNEVVATVTPPRSEEELEALEEEAEADVDQVEITEEKKEEGEEGAEAKEGEPVKEAPAKGEAAGTAEKVPPQEAPAKPEGAKAPQEKGKSEQK